MAEAVTIARPYAEAVFEIARAHANFRQWSDMLELIALVVADPAIQRLIDNPDMPAAELEGLVLGVCGARLDGEGRNLVQVLVHNRRLAVLPEIRTLFAQLEAQHAGVLHARIWSAMAIDEAQLQRLVAELEAKYGRKISATVDVDRSLIGGVKIAVGDKVLDATVRGRLNAMTAALTR